VVVVEIGTLLAVWLLQVHQHHSVTYSHKSPSPNHSQQAWHQSKQQVPLVDKQQSRQHAQEDNPHLHKDQQEELEEEHCVHQQVIVFNAQQEEVYAQLQACKEDSGQVEHQ
jgi:hypothetical protein